MAKSKLGRNPFQLKTTSVETNPLFTEPEPPKTPRSGARSRVSRPASEVDPVGVLFAADPDSFDEVQPNLRRTVTGLAALGLLKGYAIVRGLMAR